MFSFEISYSEGVEQYSLTVSNDGNHVHALMKQHFGADVKYKLHGKFNNVKNTYSVVEAHFGHDLEATVSVRAVKVLDLSKERQCAAVVIDPEVNEVRIAYEGTNFKGFIENLRLQGVEFEECELSPAITITNVDRGWSNYFAIENHYKRFIVEYIDYGQDLEETLYGNDKCNTWTNKRFSEFIKHV